ncbi:MAG: Ltp family lipoprotein [Patescibacteria group bacterium]
MDDLFLFLILLSLGSLIYGLIKPSSFERFIKGKVTRKKTSLLFGGAFIVFFVLFGITTETTEKVDPELDVPKSESDVVENKESREESITEEVKEVEQPTQTDTTKIEEESESEPEKPKPIDGGWSRWSKWSECQINPPDLECGESRVEGEKIRTRTCDDPKPAYGGEKCVGLSEETESCEIVYDHGNCSDGYKCTNNVCESKPESDNTTLGEKNALRSAEDYLNYTSFSREGLIEQLEYDGFTHKEAVYGAENCGADWNKQAAKSAEDYLNYTSFSREGLIEQLEYDGFTRQQAKYGAEAVGY